MSVPGMTWIDDPETQNLASGGQVMVPFGPENHQKIPVVWAERMLTQLAKDSPRTFQKLLGQAAMGQQGGQP